MSTDLQLGYHELPRLLTLMTGDEKHDPAALSTLVPIWVLYDRVLRVDPERPDDPERDRFYLSKGHGPQAYFAVLAAGGFFGVEELESFGRFDSHLGHHPHRLLVPGVDISSGSLGHGLAMAAGTAIGLRAQGRSTPRIFCLLGDAELDEGSNHEAIAFAGRSGLDRLTAVVVDNDSSSFGWPGGVERRFTAEGWTAARRSAEDPDALADALLAAHEPGCPNVVVVNAAPKPTSWRPLTTAAHNPHTSTSREDR